jgi:GTPase-associated system-like protein
MGMNPRFPDWYRSVTVTPVEGLILKRWNAIEQLAQNPKPEFVIALLRLFLLPDSTESSVPEGLVEAFRANDEAFPSKGNLYEIRILAGVILRQIIEEKNSVATFAALGIACASFAGLDAIPEKDHVEAAEEYLVNSSDSIRERVAPAAIKIPALTKEKVKELMPEASVQPNAQFQEALFNTLSALISQTSTSLAQVQLGMQQQQHSIRVQDEELNLLWWLQTAFSRDLEKRFEEVEPSAATLLFPMELADLTVFVPGPNTIAGILSHAFREVGVTNGAAVTLAQAVNSLPRNWREKTVRKYDLGGLAEICPILLAVQKSLETDGIDEWLPVYRKASGIAADTSFETLRLSLQVYRERLLLRTIGVLKQ